MKRGVTLLEVMIVSFISIIVLLVIYGLLHTGDSLYQSESVIRDTQFQIRRWLEQVSREIEETNAGYIWTFSDGTIAGGPNRVAVILSARDPADSSSFSGVRPSDVRNPAAPIVMQISWKSLIVYYPWRNPQGELELRRQMLAYTQAPTAVTAAFTGTIRLTVSGPAGNTIFTIDRSGGVQVLEDLHAFELAPANTGTVGPSPTPLSTTYTVNLGRVVKIPPKIFSPVVMSTTALARN